MEDIVEINTKIIELESKLNSTQEIYQDKSKIYLSFKKKLFIVYLFNLSGKITGNYIAKSDSFMTGYIFIDDNEDFISQLSSVKSEDLIFKIMIYDDYIDKENIKKDASKYENNLIETIEFNQIKIIHKALSLPFENRLNYQIIGFESFNYKATFDSSPGESSDVNYSANKQK